MSRRLQNRLKFHIERYVQRGALYQLLFIAALIALVALLGGAVVWLAGDFDAADEAVWWSFLRLTDPGYLGDDEGVLRRTVSTVLTVLGFVLFVGALIATLTQWLNRTMRSLERGLTPISIRNHILILGWTNRTPAIIRELMLSEGRVRRFLSRLGTRRLRIVVLAGEVGSDTLAALRQQLGRDWDQQKIILRSGSPLRMDHLERVDFRRAGVILLPGADFAPGGAEQSDPRVVKTLLSISNYGDADAHRPPVVAELLDAEKVTVARKAYRGELDLVASDAFMGRLVVQNVRHPGLSHVYAELLTHRFGNEIYVRGCPELAGRPFHSVQEAFAQAIPLGVVRPAADGYHALLNPPGAYVVAPEDRLVLLARAYAETTPGPPAVPTGARPPAPPAAPLRRPQPPGGTRRILVLGWSHRVPALLQAFAGYAGERFAVDVLSVVPAHGRAARLAHLAEVQERLVVRQLEGDYTRAGELARHDPASYDNIILVGSDWVATDEDSDARTVLGYVLLMSVLEAAARVPNVIVELVDPENEKLFRRRTGEVIVSPLILSHLLAHVALRRELNAVFAELFGSGGADITFRPAADYAAVGAGVAFRAIRQAAAARGEIALGVRHTADDRGPNGGLRLNPDPRLDVRLAAHDEVVVLADDTTGEKAP